MDNHKEKRRRLQRRHMRVRRRIRGTSERPRLSVYRSLKHVYAQLIDDRAGRTIAAASTRNAEVRDQVQSTGTQEAAAAVGALLARKATGQDIRKIVFDRGGRRYHGRVRALAEAARKGGLEF